MMIITIGLKMTSFCIAGELATHNDASAVSSRPPNIHAYTVRKNARSRSTLSAVLALIHAGCCEGN
jgi:hypothetical protein